MSAITDYDVPRTTESAPAATEQTVPIVLTTSLSQYAIPSGPYMVPVSWRRTHLSTLVNKLVASSSSADAGQSTVPFDFIVDSALLRTTLGEYLEAAGLTSESTLAIEYVRSTLPPTRLAAFEHDDWVASVDCSYKGVGASTSVYMTASYDGSVRLFSPTNPEEAAHTFSTLNKAVVQAGKNSSLTSAVWTPNSDAIVTGGMDGRVQLWNVDQSEEAGWRSTRKWQGEAHNAPVSAVDAAQGPSGVSVLSGGWDGVVALWDDLGSLSSLTSTNQEELDSEAESADESTAKRRKTANGKTSSSKPAKASSGSRPGQLEPTMVLWHSAPAAHPVTGAKNVLTPTSRINSVLFERSFASASAKDSNRAWTAGYNGQLRGFDLASGGTLHTSLSLPSSTAESRPILSVTHLAPSTLVTGSVDRAIHIFDIRGAASGALGIGIANAHRGPVDVVRAHPLDRHLFASASASQAGVKVWDTRSSKKALFSLGVAEPSQKREQSGVLGLDWSIDGQEVVAGGKDKRITVYRGSNIGVSDA